MGASQLFSSSPAERRVTGTSRRVAVVLLAAAAFTSSAACADPEAGTADGSSGATGAAVTVAGSMADVCKAAAREGELVSWNSEDPVAYQKIFEDFAKTYPGIKLNSVEVRPDDLVQKLVTESDAGHPSGVDAISIMIDKSGPLFDNHLINTDIDFTKMGVKPNYISNTNAVRTERIAIGVVYNTDQVQESDLPDTWDGLVNPKWAGKVVVDPRGDQLQLLAIAWGKDKTVDFVKRLKQTDKPQVVQGATAGLLTVASGENKITTNGPAAETAEQQSKGAPVAIRYLDVVPAVDYYTAVPTGAPHPNAGACWTAWLNSDAGRKAKEQYAFKANDDLPPKAGNARLAVIEGPRDAALVADTVADISAIWAGRS
jgi:iron(III) transport system substrate-binding protein